MQAPAVITHAVPTTSTHERVPALLYPSNWSWPTEIVVLPLAIPLPPIVTRPFAAGNVGDELPMLSEPPVCEASNDRAAAPVEVAVAVDVPM